VNKFGEPEEKQGGGAIEISLIYNRLGLEFTFLTKLWNLKAGITQLVMFPPKHSDPICGVCRKSAFTACPRCNLIYYCSRECEEFHRDGH
jgi:hypothetical protein